jgi:glycosyltransferase involved in cell wall biosynthesis
MRVAFYAPLKPPSHPVPSGDRRIARLLLQALRSRGHDVRVVSTFRSYEGKGDRAQQLEIKKRGAAEAERLLRTVLKRWRPQAWFTYHLYQKAPDWLGPPLAKKLGVPYVIAEAAYAPTRAAGRWDEGLEAVAAALRQADTVLMLNPNDEECVAPLVRRRSGGAGAGRVSFQALAEFGAWEERASKRPPALEPLLPFLDVRPYGRAYLERARHRRALARRFGIAAAAPWLIAVAMMRKGDKLASYRLLARALQGLADAEWQLLIVGDGPARDEVQQLFAPFGRRAHFLGALPERALAEVYAASDLFVWPAINEAIGMAILEAQASWLPAIVGDAGATSVIVADGKTGRVVPVGRVPPFRRALAELLARPSERSAMSEAAGIKTVMFHELLAAAAQLDATLRGAVARAGKRRR